jgi:hypothetical protein
MIYEILSVASFALSLSLMVYGHMLRIQIQAQQGRIAAYCEETRKILHNMSDILVDQEKGINALYAKILELENPKEKDRRESVLTMQDVLANIDGAAISDGDLE